MSKVTVRVKYALPIVPLCVLTFLVLLVVKACGAGISWLGVFLPLIVLLGFWVLFVFVFAVLIILTVLANVFG
jgi:hypothetical protein